MRSQWMLVPVKPNEAMIKGSDFVSRRSAIETWAGYLGAVPEAPKACLENSVGFLQGVLDWNRAQPQPPIAVGFEYGVATAVLGMIPQYDGKAAAVVEVRNAGTAAECVTAELIGPPLANGTKLYLQSNASEVELLTSVAASAAERLQEVERERDMLRAELASQGEGRRLVSDELLERCRIATGSFDGQLYEELTQLLATPAGQPPEQTVDVNPAVTAPQASSAGFSESARALREHENNNWLGSKGHHTGFVAAAVFLEKLAAGSEQVAVSAPGAASVVSTGEHA